MKVITVISSSKSLPSDLIKKIKPTLFENYFILLEKHIIFHGILKYKNFTLNF